jgi:hypothetical protein
MRVKDTRTCLVCGTQFPATSECCPVCLLRIALDKNQASSKKIKPARQQVPRRFGHYELVKGKDGMPVELGRGAMGVTYKAIDVDLRCPVTLKVVNETYLGDESARLRFVREARAAASVRHPNVVGR